MNHEPLIARLAQDTHRVPPSAPRRRLALGLGAGALVALLLVVFLLGFNPKLDLAIRHYSFWMKWGYTISLGLCAIAATVHLARPDSGPMRWLWIMALPVASLSVIGLFEMRQVPSAQWLAMWLGDSWHDCSALVLLLSLPIFAGLLWSFRSLAPTRLRAAGATAGLTAGAWAATIYCLHCPEVSAIFVLTWYTLGIALAALVGAIVGPRLLRW